MEKFYCNVVKLKYVACYQVLKEVEFAEKNWEAVWGIINYGNHSVYSWEHGLWTEPRGDKGASRTTAGRAVPVERTVREDCEVRVRSENMQESRRMVLLEQRKWAWNQNNGTLRDAEKHHETLWGWRCIFYKSLC